MIICSSAWIDGFAAIEAEALGAGVLDVEELLESFGFDKLIEDRALYLPW